MNRGLQYLVLHTPKGITTRIRLLGLIDATGRAKEIYTAYENHLYPYLSLRELEELRIKDIPNDLMVQLVPFPNTQKIEFIPQGLKRIPDLE